MDPEYKIIAEVVFSERVYKYELVGEVVMHDKCYKVVTEDTTYFFPIAHTVIELK